MKHNGALMEYSHERMEDLMRAYDCYLKSCKYIRMTEVYKAIVNMPASRFWVSDIRASVIISSMMRGERPLAGMRPLKRQMYQEIYRRVLKLRKQHPEMSVLELCANVVAQPAPKFYLTPGSAKIMVCKVRKKWQQEKLRKLHLL